MSTFSTSRPAVKPAVSPVAYRLALQQFRASVQQMQLAAQRLRSLPPLSIDAAGPEAKVAFDSACEDAAALSWAADRSQQFIGAVASRFQGHAVERSQRDDGAMPADDADDCCDLAELAAALAS